MHSGIRENRPRPCSCIVRALATPV